MSALVFYTPSEMTAPRPDTPRLPDTVSGLAVDIDPSKITGVADGARVASLIAEGDGSVRERTFDTRRPGALAPIFDADGGANGGPCLVFTGSEAMANGSASAGTYPDARDQPITYAIVAKHDVPPGGSGHNQRLVTGCRPEAGTSNIAIQPQSTGSGVSMVASADGSPPASEYFAINAPAGQETGWYVLVVCFNGAQSKARGLRGTLQNFSQELGQDQGMSIGAPGSGSTNLSNLFNGKVQRMMKYHRALSDTDINALYLGLCRSYGITA